MVFTHIYIYDSTLKLCVTLVSLSEMYVAGIQPHSMTSSTFVEMVNMLDIVDGCPP